MNALKTTYTRKRGNPPSEHMHSLERQQRYLATLFHQLNSYQCVPRTAVLHEQIELLRRSFRKLMDENETLKKADRKTSESDRQHLDKCEIQFRKLLQLERDVLTYIGKARIHG